MDVSKANGPAKEAQTILILVGMNTRDEELMRAKCAQRGHDDNVQVKRMVESALVMSEKRDRHTATIERNVKKRKARDVEFSKKTNENPYVQGEPWRGAEKRYRKALITCWRVLKAQKTIDKDQLTEILKQRLLTVGGSRIKRLSTKAVEEFITAGVHANVFEMDPSNDDHVLSVYVEADEDNSTFNIQE